MRGWIVHKHCGGPELAIFAKNSEGQSALLTAPSPCIRPISLANILLVPLAVVDLFRLAIRQLVVSSAPAQLTLVATLKPDVSLKAACLISTVLAHSPTPKYFALV